MITLTGLTKKYGDTHAVDDLTTTIRPGVVTGFLGPNGAGKSTTMRMMVGLDRPTSGSVTIDGQPYAGLRHPLHTVGALIDATIAHPGLTAANHLQTLAASNRIPKRRVAEVLETVGLSAVAGRRTRSFSLGMGQRLGIAAALLGDPPVLLLDEPVNGLDPDGVRWIRRLVRSLAAEGRTVLVSSHLMSEMQLTADHLIVIGRGRLIADAPLDEVINSSSMNVVRVHTPDADLLREAVICAGGTVRPGDTDELLVTGLPLSEIGDLAHRQRVRLHELTMQSASLEEAYLELTSTALEYRTDAGSEPESRKDAS